MVSFIFILLSFVLNGCGNMTLRVCENVRILDGLFCPFGKLRTELFPFIFCLQGMWKSREVPYP